MFNGSQEKRNKKSLIFSCKPIDTSKKAYKKERRDCMENKFIRVDEVAQELSVSKPYAYKLIKKLNDELKEKGFITIAGRVNRQYFQERLYGAGKGES